MTAPVTVPPVTAAPSFTMTVHSMIVRSQYAMLLLMVLLTGPSLVILAG